MPADPVLGQIMPAAFNVIPRGWHLCDGSLLAISANAALFSLLGTIYGGNGTTNFALPDLRGRAILGSSGTSGQYPQGSPSGSTSVSLTPSQIPAHNHLIQASTTAGSGGFPVSPVGRIFAATSTDEKIFATAGSAEVTLTLSTNVVNDGGSLPHNNMQPYLAINYMIALQGIYPSRN
jgi:microcystin-dependent protein